MKNLKVITSKILALLFCGIISFSNVKAQDEIGAIIKAGSGDATKLADAYLQPFFKGFGIGLNNGWYTTGRPKKLGQFSITGNVSLALVPVDDRSFNVAQIGLNSPNLKLKAGSNPVTPSIAGESRPGSVFEVFFENPQTNQLEKVDEFTLPQGIGFSFIPTPQAQVTIGLPGGTQVSGRYLPSISIGDAGSVKLFGGAVQHSISQYLPGLADKLVDISIMVGYTKLDFELPLDVQPQTGPGFVNPNPGDYTTQRLGAEFSGLTVNGIVSRKLGPISIYGSAGFGRSTYETGLFGTYPFIDRIDNMGRKVYANATDPVVLRSDGTNSVPLSSEDFKAFAPKFGAGFSLKLFILNINADLQISQYTSGTVGVSLGL